MSRRAPGQAAFGFSRRYIVRCNGMGECRIDAPDAPAAKYRAFQLAREAGYRGDFIAFVERGVTVHADRRSLRLGEIAPELGL